jgi:NAD dependent epimerase/dehydratase
MTWQNKRVLVTGAGGFIGSHLVERLVELGASVRALIHYNALGSWGWLDYSPHRERIEVIMGDLTDRDLVFQAARNVEIVFHLGALIAIPYSYQAPSSYVRTNIEGTLNILLAARDLKVGRLVHTSTSEVYGTARYVPIDENPPATKDNLPILQRKSLRISWRKPFIALTVFRVVIVRPFNTYGPRQSTRAVIPTIISQCLNGDTIRLGHLHPTRDLNYVSDTVEGFIRAATADNVLGQTINLGSGREISIGNLALLIARLLGKQVQIITDERRRRPEKSEVERLLADNSKAKRLLGWEPRVSLEEGLLRTIDWMREHRRRYRLDNHSI